MSNNFVSAILRQLVCSVVLLCCVCAARGQFDTRSDGSDGAFSPTANTVIDLGLASTGPWNSTPVTPGRGVYDPDQWIVVFKYSSVNIPAGVTVSFKNHPSNPPVVWLVQGTVTIGGWLNLNGSSTDDGSIQGYQPGGPGAFRGGRSNIFSTPGFGPGAPLVLSGDSNSAYINSGGFPLIGGSGASNQVCDPGCHGRGGGGGAILIAAGVSLQVSGLISANGGARNASGGLIRLASPIVSGFGNLSVATNLAAFSSTRAGRIRIEAEQISISPTLPVYSSGPLGTQIRFLRDEFTPAVRVVSVGGVGAPAEPRAQFELPGEIVVATRQVQVVVECKNVPSNSTVKVYLRSASNGGTHSVVNATFQSGTTAQSTWIATGDLGAPAGYSTVQAHVVLP